MCIQYTEFTLPHFKVISITVYVYMLFKSCHVHHSSKQKNKNQIKKIKYFISNFHCLAK